MADPVQVTLTVSSVGWLFLEPSIRLGFSRGLERNFFAKSVINIAERSLKMVPNVNPESSTQFAEAKQKDRVTRVGIGRHGFEMQFSESKLSDDREREREREKVKLVPFTNADHATHDEIQWEALLRLPEHLQRTNISSATIILMSMGKWQQLTRNQQDGLYHLN
jgi:predicted DNA-binding transcriptional regulator AlpA